MAPSRQIEHHKVIIVGAGFTGLAAAKTYLTVEPNTSLLIIDEESGVGGVWAASRIYPGLEYEQPAPLMNYSDFDIREELGINTWEDVNGEQVNRFLVSV